MFLRFLCALQRKVARMSVGADASPLYFLGEQNVCTDPRSPISHWFSATSEASIVPPTRKFLNNKFLRRGPLLFAF